MCGGLACTRVGRWESGLPAQQPSAFDEHSTKMTRAKTFCFPSRVGLMSTLVWSSCPLIIAASCPPCWAAGSFGKAVLQPLFAVSQRTDTLSLSGAVLLALLFFVKGWAR